MGSLASVCFSHTSLVLLFILSRGGGEGGLKNIYNPLLSKRYLLLFYNLFRSYILPPTTLLKGISFQIVILYSSPRPPPSTLPQLLLSIISLYLAHKLHNLFDAGFNCFESLYTYLYLVRNIYMHSKSKTLMHKCTIYMKFRICDIIAFSIVFMR